MKKIVSILCILSALSFSAQAGHSENTRSKCRWWAKRYAANGHIATSKCGIKYSYGHDGGCDWAEVYFTRDWCCGTSAEVYSHSDGGGQSGHYYAACSMSGATLSDLYLDITAEDGSTDVPDYTPGTQDGSNIPIFETGVVSISGISINLQSDIKDPHPNTYTLAVWVPNDDSTKEVEDSVYTPEKAIVYGTVTINGGALTVTGGLFDASDFAVSTTDAGVNVRYVGGDKKVPLSDKLSVDNVAVISFGDIQPDESALFKKAVTTNNGIISGNVSISTYPNPASNTLNVAVITPEATKISISLYDVHGKLIMQQKDQSMNAGTNNTTIDITALPTGNYFLLAEGAGMKVIKQFVKNK
jgi:hypothetical protein